MRSTRALRLRSCGERHPTETCVEQRLHFFFSFLFGQPVKRKPPHNTHKHDSPTLDLAASASATSVSICIADNATDGGGIVYPTFCQVVVVFPRSSSLLSREENVCGLTSLPVFSSASSIIVRSSTSSTLALRFFIRPLFLHRITHAAWLPGIAPPGARLHPP